MQIRQTHPEVTAPVIHGGVSVLSFTECDQFAEAIQHEDAEVLPTESGCFHQEIILMPLAGTVARYGTHDGSWLCSGTASRGHVSVVLDTVSSGPTMQNGQPIYEAQAFGLHGPGAEHFSISSPGEYFFAPFPEREFQDAWRTATRGDRIIGAGEFQRICAEGPRWKALLETIAAVRHLAMKQPEVWHDPRQRAAMERSLLSACVLAGASDPQCTAAHTDWLSPRDHARVLRRALAHLQEHAEQPVYTLDLCASTGVSERTLRTVFREYFGMGPMHYLKLHRLQQVRRALCSHSPVTPSVKSIALAHGFWELGRFAADYRRLFGESPSDTLRTALKLRPVSPRLSPIAHNRQGRVSLRVV
jgi:AraC family ethanolamine operon transcriptional activator